MSSPCRTSVGLAAGALTLVAAGCRPATPSPPVALAQPGPQPVVSQLFPGGTQPPPEDPRGKIYDGNPYYISQGKRYYSWYNCDGCHFNGGGGIGPAFMDKVWIYGGRIDEIHNSIAQGRPNGMPTWREKIPDPQIWEIAAYVRSLSTPATKGEQPPGAPPAPSQPPANPNNQGGTTVPGAAAAG